MSTRQLSSHFGVLQSSITFPIVELSSVARFNVHCPQTSQCAAVTCPGHRWWCKAKLSRFDVDLQWKEPVMGESPEPTSVR